MKVCLATYCKGFNYGAHLQAWATGKVLQGWGHQVEYVNYRQPWSYGGPFLSWNYWFSRSPWCVFRGLYGLFRSWVLRCYFCPMEKHYAFGRIDYATKIEYLRRRPPQGDCYLTGSDQVWTGPWRYCAAYFLDFGDATVPRVAYGPSLGGGTFELQKVSFVKPCLQRYSALSVREQEAADYLVTLGFSKVFVVPDPTLLLTAEAYRVLYKTETPLCSDVFVYLLGASIQTLRREIDAVLTPHSLNISLQKFRSRVARNKLLTVPSFINAIANADKVLTNSFHGTVFAILHHKPFCYILFAEPEQRKNERVLNLLRELGLMRCAVKFGEKITFNGEIDWEEVERKLETLRSRGVTYLKQSLRQCLE